MDEHSYPLTGDPPTSVQCVRVGFIKADSRIPSTAASAARRLTSSRRHTRHQVARAPDTACAMSVHARVRLVSPSAGSSSRDSSAGSGALLPRDAEKKPPKQMKRKTSHTTNTTTTATSAMEATEGEETGQGQGDTDREQGRTWVAADPARAARPLAHLLSPAGGIGDGVLAPHLSHLASIPFAPILRPSAEEFGDSMAYISAVSRRYSNTHGLVQIVPPAGWQPSMTVDLRTRRSLAFDVRVQQVQKPERRVVQRTHPKVQIHAQCGTSVLAFSLLLSLVRTRQRLAARPHSRRHRAESRPGVCSLPPERSLPAVCSSSTTATPSGRSSQRHLSSRMSR